MSSSSLSKGKQPQSLQTARSLGGIDSNELNSPKSPLSPGNRASLVFQQLHASISSSRSSHGQHPWALRRSITIDPAEYRTSRIVDRQSWHQNMAGTPLTPKLAPTGLPSRQQPVFGWRGPVSQSVEEVTPLLQERISSEQPAVQHERSFSSSRKVEDAVSKLKDRVVGYLLPVDEQQRIDVFKAVLAYALAALFPFVPVLRDWLGDPDYMAPHLVTNATIWFHAAKARSGLVEGGLVGLVWVLVSSCVSYIALYIAEYLHCWYANDASGVNPIDGVPEAMPLALQSKVVSLVIFIFGYSWCLAFFKANANRPSVNTGTSIANIAFYLVMLREAPIVNYKAAATGSCAATGGYTSMGSKVPWPMPDDAESLAESVGRKTEHILVAVLTGMAISFLVGWIVKPTKSGDSLRKELDTTLDSFRNILPQLLAPIVSEQAPLSTQTKVGGAKPAELKAALRAHRQKLQSLKRQLSTLSLNPTDWKVWARRKKLETFASCLDGLGLHLGSMSSGLELRVIDHNSDAYEGDVDMEAYSMVIQRIRSPVVQLGQMCDKAMRAIHDMVDLALSGEQPAEPQGVWVDSSEFLNGVCECAVPLPDETAAHCQQCGKPVDYDPATRKIMRLRAEMEDAIQEFHSDYNAAIGDLGSQPAGPHAMAEPLLDLSAQWPAGFEPTSKTMEEQLFIVYFFIFSLREFADELSDILPQVAAVCRPPVPFVRALKLGLQPRNFVNNAWSFGQWMARHFRMLWNTGATTELEARYEIAQFTDPRSLHAPRPSTRTQQAAHVVWRLLMWTRRLNVKFATKYALLVTLLSLPCYWSMEMYFGFRENRLDWMVISAAAIMVPTVGGSLIVSVYRVLGTCAGGLLAFLVYEVGSQLPVLTYVLLVLFSIPCFHIMLHGTYPKIGQFALITFGVVLINKWVAREDREESAGGLAARRTMAVALGVCAGMFVTMYIWPFEARVRVRQALSWWLLTASMLYDKLWSGLWQPQNIGSEWHALSTVREYLDNELQLQGSLMEIRTLLQDTVNEPRLKGPFPRQTYERIINACQRMLDAMVAARWVVVPMPMFVTSHVHSPPTGHLLAGSFSEHLETVHRALDRCGHADTPAEESSDASILDTGNTTEEEEGQVILDLPLGLASTALLERDAGLSHRLNGLLDQKAADERADRDSLVALMAFVLASALVLKAPMPTLPPIQMAQRRVAQAMRGLLEDDAVMARIRYVFYYTQVMLGWEIVHELAIIGTHMRELYGSYQ
ncbi:hypothetical protein GGI25_001877 [Coemansia spiralis]|uniref:DUF2421 domain-containing protein n=2 Tax=Coemansia TaxID=4863 RepID=A0A9W8KZ53_9FUNG|nr:hypothetical protein EDC05_001828 [Coemansia umbellata]KAJ2618866.1 hypothetical protein GGI26_006292 [Coemansia sp. RSA 1358]KAJ2679104.1 hypothetical protein GGI25_001877 [Coemansia spiralis]